MSVSEGERREVCISVRLKTQIEVPRLVKINGKKIFIQRIYTELAAAGEEKGWSDWSEKEKPYQKFKYTTPWGLRIVFIIPKETPVTLKEFAKALEKREWFFELARRTYAKYCVRDIYAISRAVLYAIGDILTKYELIGSCDLINPIIENIEEKLRRITEIRINGDSWEIEVEVAYRDSIDPMHDIEVTINLPLRKYMELIGLRHIHVKDVAVLFSMILRKSKVTKKRLMRLEERLKFFRAEQIEAALINLLSVHALREDWESRLKAWLGCLKYLGG